MWTADRAFKNATDKIDEEKVVRGNEQFDWRKSQYITKVC